MTKQVNQDLKNLKNWLNANKICLNVAKTEIVLFKFKCSLKLKLNGKRLYLTNSVKYLGIKIGENLNLKQQISNIVIKLK